MLELAKIPFREMLERASRTQPESNIRPLYSIDQLAKKALDITNTVVDAQAKFDKLTKAYKDALEEVEVYKETLVKEFEQKIMEAELALRKSEVERKKAQFRVIRQQIEMGVFEGVRDINELARSKEFKDESE